MSSLMEQFANKVTAWRAPHVQNSVARYGGLCTYPFTQCKPPVSSFIGQDTSTSGGVCESLSAHWIYYHANDDSLWNWLIVNGTVSIAKLHYHIMQLQSQGILGADQDQVTEAWLRSKGIHRRQSNSVLNKSRQMGRHFFTAQGASTPARQSGTSGMFSAGALANAIVQDDTLGAGSYKKLGLYGKAGDHAMALWVAQDVAFFDPNFGEFWFSDKAAFQEWFTKSFWITSLYNLGLSGSFDLLPYAKKI